MLGAYKLVIGVGVITAITITFYVLTSKLEIANIELNTNKHWRTN